MYDWFVLFCFVLFLPAFLDWFWSIRISNSSLGSCVVDLSDWCSSSSFIYLSMIDRLIHSFIHSSNPSIILSIYCTACHALLFIWCRFVMSCHVNACRIHVKNLKFLISEFSILFAPGSVLFPPYYYFRLVLSPKLVNKSWVDPSRG